MGEGRKQVQSLGGAGAFQSAVAAHVAQQNGDPVAEPSPRTIRTCVAAVAEVLKGKGRRRVYEGIPVPREAREYPPSRPACQPRILPRRRVVGKMCRTQLPRVVP